MRFQRSSLAMKLIILLPAVAAAVTLLSLQTKLQDRQQRAAELEAEVTAAEQENRRLEEAIAASGTDEGVKDAARQKLGLAEPSELVFYDLGSASAGK